MQVSAPTTLEQVLKEIGKEARGLTGYKDSWTLNTTAGQEKLSMRVMRSIDGKRGAMGAFLNGNLLVLVGSNSKESFFVLYPNRVYTKYSAGNPWYDRAPNLSTAGLQDGDFNINFDGLYDMVVTSVPTLKLDGIENGLFEGKPCRVVQASAKRPTGSGVDFSMWLMKDKWIPLRVEAKVTQRDGGKVSFIALRDRIETAAKFTNAEFDFPKDLVDGFKEEEWKRVVPGFLE
jgi:hypothetical protein